MRGTSVFIIHQSHSQGLPCTREYSMIYRGPSFRVQLNDSAPRLHPPSPSYHSFSVFLCATVRAYWRDRGEGEGVKPNNTTARKLGPLKSTQSSLPCTNKLAERTGCSNREIAQITPIISSYITVKLICSKSKVAGNKQTSSSFTIRSFFLGVRRTSLFHFY